ncbi:MAG: hypothetical protein IKN72_03625 [Clostridia bacterium]|nr:hypothetical protein [Clostridia bacterium]
MYYYEQVERETNEHICYLTCSVQLQDNHQTIRLIELTEEEYYRKIEEENSESEV